MRTRAWIFALGICGALADSARAALTVQCMPDGLVRAYAWVGRELPVWGRVVGGVPPYDYDWEFGDGSPRAKGRVTDPRHILVPHIYQAAGAYTARLTVTDAQGASASAVVRLRVTPTATPRDQVNAAIQDGLRYLYLNQYRDGSWYGGPYGGGSYVGGTGMAVLAFEEHGYRVRDGGIYADTVQAGLDYIFSKAQIVSVDAASDGYNANGRGCGFYTTTSGDLRHSYEVGIAMMAIVASGTPDAVIRTGPLAGRTYRYAVEEAVDWCAWAQNDSGSGTGGWRYTANYIDSDNSVTQWPAIGLEAAESGWGIVAPAFVKQRLLSWLAYSQHANGGFGYHTPSSPNFARSGGAFCALAYADVPVDDRRMRRLLDYFRANWNTAGYDGNKQNLYAMYGFAKGARISDPPVRFLGDLDWQEDYNAYLRGKQRYALSGGSSWSAEHLHISDSPPHLGTALALLILSPGVFCLPPVAVAGEDIEVAPGETVVFDGSGSYHQDPSGSIVFYDWDVDGDGVFDLRGRTVVHTQGYKDTGAEYSVKVTLRVIGSTPDPHCQDFQVSLDTLTVRVVPGIRPLRLHVSGALEAPGSPGTPISWTLKALSATQPVPGARVAVRDALAGTTGVLETGQDGTVVYTTRPRPDAAAGTYQILFGPATKAGYAASATAVRWVHVGPRLSLTATPVADPVVRPGQGEVGWTVRVEAGGEPVSGAEVAIVDELQGATAIRTTGRDGSLRYATGAPSHRAPGLYTVAFGPALRSGYRGSGIVTRRVVVSGPLRLLVSEHEPPEVLPGAQVGWQLAVLLGGSPVAGASVPVLETLTGGSTVLKTDVRGGAVYTVTAPWEDAPRDFRAIFGPAGKPGFSESELVEREVRVTPRLELLVSPLRSIARPDEKCTWTLQALTPTGRGVSDVTIPVSDELSSTSAAMEIKTGAGGYAEYAVVVRQKKGGSYSISFGPPRKEGYASSHLPVKAKVLVIDQGTVARVTGRVCDISTFAPIAGATVSLAASSRKERSTVTDRAGGFAFDEVESGFYRLSVSAQAYAKAEETIEVRPKVVERVVFLSRLAATKVPVITSVDSKYTSSDGRTIFLHNVGRLFSPDTKLSLEFEVDTEWHGLTGKELIFEAWNPQTAQIRRLEGTKESKITLEVAQRLQPGERLRVIAIATTGETSAPKDAGIEVAALPPGLMVLAGGLLPLGCPYAKDVRGQLLYACDTEFRPEKLCGGEIKLPEDVPILGGRSMSLPVDLRLATEIGTDGSCEISSELYLGLPKRLMPSTLRELPRLLGVEFGIGAELELFWRYRDFGGGWFFDGGSLGIGGDITKHFGPFPFVFPPPLPPIPGYGRGGLTLKATFAGEVTGLADGVPEVKGLFEPSATLLLAGGAGVYATVAAELRGEGELRAVFDLSRHPRDSFRTLWGNLKLRAAVVILGFEKAWDLWELGERCLVGPDCGGGAMLVGISGPLDLADFCPLDRSYLRGRGIAAEGRAAGGDGEVVETGIFPYPFPQLIALGEQVLLVWTRDDGSAEPENRTAIAWSLWDGAAWSDPQPIAPDGTADFAPALAATDLGALCAWQDLREPLAADAGVEDAIVRSEISVAAFDTRSGEWSPALRFTDDDALDRSPNLAAAGSRALVVWVRNPTGDIFGRPDAPNSVLCSEKTPVGWSSPRVVAEGLSAITETALAFDGDHGYFVFVQDEDGDLGTPGDRDLYLLRYEFGAWSPIARLTHDDADDQNPQVSLLPGGQPLLLWFRDGRIEACVDFRTEEAFVVSDAPEAAEAFEFAVIGGPGGERSVFWSARSEGEADLYACVSSEGGARWGPPVRITNDAPEERMVAGAALPDGSLVAAYAQVPIPEGEGTWRDLVVRRVPALPDLAVVSEEIVLEEEDAAEGQEVVSATVRNVGIAPTQGGAVEFWLRMPEVGLVLLGRVDPAPGAIGPGESARVSVPVPSDSPRGVGEVCVVVDGAGLVPDAARENNAACAQVWKPDLTLSGLRPVLLGDGSVLVALTVGNVGEVPSPESSVELRLRSRDQTLGQSSVPGLGPGEVAELSFLVPPLAAGPRGFDLEAIADPARVLPELDRSNNRRTLWVPLGLRGARFLRGDADGDGAAKLADALYVLRYLFSGGVSLFCEDAADVNDDGDLDISDPVYLLCSLFLGGPPVPPPYPEAGFDMTADRLGCERPSG